MKSRPDTELKYNVIKTAQKAGQAVLEVYSSDFSVEYKDDRSPLTLADKKADSIITELLSGLYPDIPILSEESKAIPYQERRQWDYFWMVDPLDGTKEFIKRNGEFTVNIALIEKNTPVLGVVYAPQRGLLYFGTKGEGAYKLDTVEKLKDCRNFDEFVNLSEKLPLVGKKDAFTVIASRSHMNKGTETYINELKKEYGEVSIISAGSSLKLCLVAEGSADIYPRFAPTMEWDTAAGHIVA